MKSRIQQRGWFSRTRKRQKQGAVLHRPEKTNDGWRLDKSGRDVRERLGRVGRLVAILAVLAALGWSGWRLSRLKRVECRIKDGACSAALEHYLSGFVGRSIFYNRRQVALEIADTFPRYDQVEVGLNWPNNWIVTGVLRQPAVTIRLETEKGVSQVMTVDETGVILGAERGDGLPVLRMAPLGLNRDSSRWTDERVVGSLYILLHFERVTGLTVRTARLVGDRLSLVTAGGLEVRFDPANDPDRQLDSLQAILSTARIGSNQLGKTIDLTNARPLVF